MTKSSQNSERILAELCHPALAGLVDYRSIYLESLKEFWLNF